MAEQLQFIGEQVIDQSCLLFGRQLLVEGELFDDHVVIRVERLHEAIMHLFTQKPGQFLLFDLLLDAEHQPLFSLVHSLVDQLLERVLVDHERCREN